MLATEKWYCPGPAVLTLRLGYSDRDTVMLNGCLLYADLKLVFLEGKGSYAHLVWSQVIRGLLRKMIWSISEVFSENMF